MLLKNLTFPEFRLRIRGPNSTLTSKFARNMILICPKISISKFQYFLRFCFIYQTFLKYLLSCVSISSKNVSAMHQLSIFKCYCHCVNFYSNISLMGRYFLNHHLSPQIPVADNSFIL